MSCTFFCWPCCPKPPPLTKYEKSVTIRPSSPVAAAVESRIQAIGHNRFVSTEQVSLTTALRTIPEKKSINK